MEEMKTAVTHQARIVFCPFPNSQKPWDVEIKFPWDYPLRTRWFSRWAPIYSAETRQEAEQWLEQQRKKWDDPFSLKAKGLE